MTDGETLLDVDEESTNGHRLWIASDLAVYVVASPGSGSSYHVRVPYSAVQRFDEVQTPDGVIARTLTVDSQDDQYEVTGFFKRPRQDLAGVIRQHLDARPHS